VVSDSLPVPGRAVSLSLNVRGMKRSATLSINERCRDLREAGREVCHLGFGQSPFPVPESVVEELRRNAHQRDYLPVQGLKALRKAVARYHWTADGVRGKADDVVVGPGSKELMFLLQMVFNGEIIVPTPCWVSYGPQAYLLGRPLTRLHTSFASRWRVTAEQLAEHCRRQQDDERPRLLIINSPCNPDGGVYTEAELEDLAETARNYGILVLSDEIYAGLRYSGDNVSISRFYPEGTILSSGLSKWCGAGGWRLGTFTFPPHLGWLRRAICAVASETYTTVSAPVQYAAVAAFAASEEIAEYLAHCRRILSATGRQVARLLREAGVRVHDPEGAFYVFPDFEPLRERLTERGVTNSAALCERLLAEANVALLPGVAFLRYPDELTARLSYVDFDGAEALEASRRVGLDADLPDDFVEKQCGRMMEGVRRIASWAGG
jgi:aspartate aminotransferase